MIEECGRKTSEVILENVVKKTLETGPPNLRPRNKQSCNKIPPIGAPPWGWGKNTAPHIGTFQDGEPSTILLSLE